MSLSIVRFGFPLLAFALGHVAAAQSLSGPANPVPPISTVQVMLTNDTAGFVSFPASCELRLLRHTSELVSTPLLPGQFCDAIVLLAPGETADFFFQAPGEAGSYAVVYPYSGGAATALVVAAPSERAHTIQFFPAGIVSPQSAHVADFADPTSSRWAFANTGSESHTFGPFDTIEITAPGGSSPLTSLSLASLTVAPGEVVEIALPIDGLAPAPYEVAAHYSDGDDARVTIDSGIRADGTRVDLHLRAGHELAQGGTIRMAVTYVDYDGSVPASVLYGVAVCNQPGSTTLPGGAILPLFPDTLALQSLSNGLGGLFVGNLGTITNVFGTGTPFFEGSVETISLDHPGTPGLAGFSLRMAAFALDATTGEFGASQPEKITFR